MRAFLFSFFGGFFGKLVAGVLLSVLVAVGLMDAIVGYILGPSFPAVAQVGLRIFALLLGAALVVLWIWTARHRPPKTPFVPVRDVIDYIASKSRWWATKGASRATWMISLPAVMEFNERAAQGLVSAKGRLLNSAQYRDIDAVEWRSIQLDAITVLDPSCPVTKTEDRVLFAGRVDQYEDVVVMTDCIEAIWPRATFPQRVRAFFIRKYYEWVVPTIKW
ncbi:MAG: hypothetical protein IPK59_10180 [Rhodospirillaceae bacterium]|nr:hypothetical protein [Rhodospirillaceae bacterium]